MAGIESFFRGEKVVFWKYVKWNKCVTAGQDMEEGPGAK